MLNDRLLKTAKLAWFRDMAHVAVCSFLWELRAYVTVSLTSVGLRLTRSFVSGENCSEQNKSTNS